MFGQNVFVSYHSLSSLAVVNELKAELLGKHGITAWVDRDEMQPGDSYAFHIERGIRNSPVFVIVASRSYVDILRADADSRDSGLSDSRHSDHIDTGPVSKRQPKEWISRELALAKNMNKIILPVFHGMRHDDKRDFERLTRVSIVHAGELQHQTEKPTSRTSSVTDVANSIRREVQNARVVPEACFAWFRRLVVGLACIGLALLIPFGHSTETFALAGLLALSWLLLYLLRKDPEVGTLIYYESAAVTQKDVFSLIGLFAFTVVMILVAEMVCQYCLDKPLLELVAGGAPFFLVQLIAGMLGTMGAVMLVITIAPGSIARGALVRSALKGGFFTSAIVTPAGIYGWLVRQVIQGDMFKVFIVKSLIVVPGTAIACAAITGAIVRVISLPVHRTAFIRATHTMTWVFGAVGVIFDVVALAGNTPGPNGWMILAVTPVMLIVFVAVFRAVVLVRLRLWPA